MIVVTFEKWLITLKKCAAKRGIKLPKSDLYYRFYFDNNDTPLGAVYQIEDELS